MENTKDAVIHLLANLGIFFVLVTLLTKLFHIDTLLQPNLKSKMVYCAFFLALALLVMQFPITAVAGNRIDLRCVAIYVAGIFGGPVPGIFVGSAAGLYRYSLGGTGAEIGLISSLVKGIIAGMYSKYYLRHKLTQFNPLQTLIPVGIAVVFHSLVILIYNGNPDLWPFRLWNFFFQFLGTLVLTIIIQDALKMVQKTRSLERDLVIDKVTNIYNIKFLDTYLNENLIEAQQQKRKLSVFFLDLDFFKNVNDTYGHQKGDEILFKVAQTIKKSLRPNDVVGRYGGDEFLIILSDCDTPEATAVGQRVMDNIKALRQSENLDLELSVSMGIATFPTHGSNSETLLKHADKALYTAKNSGRNKLVVAS